ncbi:hypothetical protein P43SY_003440 [Pythium insidiosum]|uniref:BTB domain-containing protein n=1 Tax=Pythium insidiosum TaxID=114742 RepID=A0AAD5LDT5_PYTIN|nr:hypothetical protein P43SY_003440 [Pythium insidiosum]
MPMRWEALRVQGATPTIKNHTATVISRTELLVFGGYDGRRNHNELYLFNSEELTWTPLTAPRVHGTPPAGRNGHSATLADRRVFIIGGWLGSGPLAAADMHVLDLPTMTWTQPPVLGTPPGPCNMHTADFIPHLRSVLVFRGGDGREYLNDLHALDVDTLQWRRVFATGQLPVPRANHSSAVINDDQIVIFGGWDGHKRLNDIHVLDTRSMVWSSVDVQCAHLYHSPSLQGRSSHLGGSVLPHPRAGMTFVRHRQRIFLFGGSGPSAQCYNDLHVFDPAAREWAEVTSIDDDAQLGAMTAMLSADMEEDNDDSSDMDHQDGVEAFSLRVDHADALDDCMRGLDDSTSNNLPSSDLVTAANPNDTFHGHQESARSRGHNQIVVVGPGPGRRAGHTCSVLEDRKLFIFGGSYGNEYLNDLHLLDTDPPPRATVTCTSSPTQMLQHALRDYVNCEAFSDVTFLVEGRVVYGHKMVLSLLSERFRGMFTGGFRESQQREIVIPEIRYCVFLRMMEYLYTGEFTPSNAVQLKAICLHFLRNHNTEWTEDQEDAARLRVEGVMRVAPVML